jgi:hypothetical protein
MGEKLDSNVGFFWGILWRGFWGKLYANCSVKSEVFLVN